MLSDIYVFILFFANISMCTPFVLNSDETVYSVKICIKCLLTLIHICSTVVLVKFFTFVVQEIQYFLLIIHGVCVKWQVSLITFILVWFVQGVEAAEAISIALCAYVADYFSCCVASRWFETAWSVFYVTPTASFADPPSMLIVSVSG